MKQHGKPDGREPAWSGHREISYAAVDRLFAGQAGPDGRVRGRSKQDYAKALDDAQAYQDRLVGVNDVSNVANTGLRTRAVTGPTTHSAYFNPDAQREHYMADPWRGGAENLARNNEYIFEELRSARTAAVQDPRAEMKHLGAAAHAIQDSYSGAHAWRDDAVYQGDPTAPVRTLHVFTPAHVVGIEDGKNTHSDEFDKPPARSGSTEAAIEATYRMLDAHEQGLRNPQQAEMLMQQTLGPMTRASAQGVTISRPGPAFDAERDRRLAMEQAGIKPVVPPAELGRLSDVLDAHRGRPASPAAPTAGPVSGSNTDAGARSAPGAGRQPGQGLTRG